jgi:hypothetical protein
LRQPPLEREDGFSHLARVFDVAWWPARSSIRSSEPSLSVIQFA